MFYLPNHQENIMVIFEQKKPLIRVSVIFLKSNLCTIVSKMFKNSGNEKLIVEKHFAFTFILFRHLPIFKTAKLAVKKLTGQTVVCFRFLGFKLNKFLKLI